MSLLRKLLQVRLVNFMIVGSIGYFINMGIYYPLTLVFQNQVTFLSRQFYLPLFLISSGLAITSNYFLNRRFTFGDSRERSLGIVKYMGTYWVSLPVEMLLIFLCVQFLSLPPVVAAALAILIVFLSRYFVVRKVVWRT
jgi:putative flippase GtrA